jgi:hypothetical protein
LGCLHTAVPGATRDVKFAGMRESAIEGAHSHVCSDGCQKKPRDVQAGDMVLGTGGKG